jgi:hypothetical protein
MKKKKPFLLKLWIKLGHDNHTGGGGGGGGGSGSRNAVDSSLLLLH